MKKGKVSERVLKRSVLKYINTENKEIIKGAGIGSDCAFLGWKEPFTGTAVITTQTVALPVKEAGKMAVYAVMNNLAASGAEAIAVTAAITLPEEILENRLQELMKQIEEVCSRFKIQIAGGHTEVTDTVKAPVITVTGFGKNVLQEENKDADLQNMDIVMTKWIGLEGTVILAKEKEKELLGRYPMPLITAAQGFEKYLPVWPEAATARKSGVYAMHDARNGGVFGSLWELSKSMGVGLSINLKEIPVKQETIEICEFFDLNPYELLSGGCLLIAASDGKSLVKTLEEEGIPAAVIGRTTANNDKVILNEEEIRFLEPAGPDEIFKVSFIEGGC